jgi:hypothetical protein
VIDLSKAENIFSIIDYREKKLQESVHARYTKKIIEGIKIICELESLVREIEKEYGSEIFKKTWENLPLEEQKETEYSFNAIINKSKDCKSKVIPLEFSSKKPSL